MTSSHADAARGTPSPRPHKSPSRGAQQRPPRLVAQLGQVEDTDPPVVAWASPYPGRRARNFITARWRWITVVALVVVACAAAMSWSRTPTYKSAADVLVQPRMFAAGTAPQAPDMGSERAVARSAAVLNIAGRMLHVPAAAVAHGLSVSVPLNTHVLHISYASSDPAVARHRAQAVADAYVKYWIAQQPPLTGVAAGAGHTRILPSAVISNAKQPEAASSPNHTVDVAIAVLIGIALAIGTAYLRDRLDDRLRGPADLEGCSGGPVVAVVPSSPLALLGTRAVICPQRSAAGAVYEDLAVHLLRMAAHDSMQLVLVTSPTGRGQTAVSANLAAALAETGKQVVLVHANLRRPLTDVVFGGNPTLGLATLLDGRATPADVLQSTGTPGLMELPAGVVNGSVPAALHSNELRDALWLLSRYADVVVINGPAVLAGEDVATLVEVADGVLLAADGRRTRRAEVHAAAARLIPARANLVGWVLANERTTLYAALRSRATRRYPPARTVVELPVDDEELAEALAVNEALADAPLADEQLADDEPAESIAQPAATAER